jgi:hypothetical protein
MNFEFSTCGEPFGCAQDRLRRTIADPFTLFPLILLATIRIKTRIEAGGKYAEKVDHHA